MEFLRQLFSSGGFQPHGFCYQWNTGLVWLNVLSDLLITLAYFAIPVALMQFIRKRKDLPFSWMFGLFGVFIVACGSTHLMEVWNLWHAQYWLAGAIKAVTAAASVPTAILLGRIVPQAVELPSIKQWIQANETLRQSEERFRLLVSGVKEYSIVTLDLEGRVTSWNAGAERIKGYSTDEMLGRHFSTFFLEDDVKQGRPALELKTAAEKGRCEDEGWRVRKDGSRFWASVLVTAMYDEKGQLRGFGKITRDITERKRAEQALARQQKTVERSNAELNAANKELEAFSYSVSHDLRAPLRAIDGFSLALLEDYSDKLDVEGKKHLGRVRAATQRMGMLIDDLLNLSRVTRAGVRLEDVNVSEVAEEVVEELQRIQPERRVACSIEKGLRATADSHLLRVVLVNLLSNAWKFTSKRDSAQIEFGKTDSNGSSAFFVRDNGAGFDQAYADRLFGAFQRLHATADFPGTGIGLATVQRVVHRHGGRIWAEGVPGQGATFYFTLTGLNS